MNGTQEKQTCEPALNVNQPTGTKKSRKVIKINKGDRFGKLIILFPYIKNKWGSPQWACLCDCGKMTIVVQYQLVSGKTSSCGCFKYNSDCMRKKATIHGYGIPGNRRREFIAWQNMIDRCYNKHDISYKNYGGRGIKICCKWIESFVNFIKDMGDCPPCYTLERIDNNENYGPINCRWASQHEQSRNKQNSLIITYDGITLCGADWAKVLGVHKTTISRYIKRGKSIKDLINNKKIDWPLKPIPRLYIAEALGVTLDELAGK